MQYAKPQGMTESDAIVDSVDDLDGIFCVSRRKQYLEKMKADRLIAAFGFRMQRPSTARRLQLSSGRTD